MFRKTSWIPGPAPEINIPTNLEVISKITKKETTTFTFNVTGPDHMGIFLSPYKGVHLDQWSVVDGKPLAGPTWKEREVYFIYYACALDCVPYTFSIILKTPKERRGPVLTIALAGHWLHGKNQRSHRFQQFLNQFPSWTVVTPWTASYTSWEF